MARLSVVGGPADGAEAAWAATVWRWITVDGRGSRLPRAGASLYLRRARAWEFAGAGAWLCSECSVLVVILMSECPLCGTEKVEEIFDGNVNGDRSGG